MDRQRARTWLDTQIRYLRANPALRKRLIWGIAGFCVLGALWIVVTGLLARQQVVRLENRLQTVKILVAQNRLDEAKQAADGIPAMARRAHLLTTGPAWWTAAHVPYLGDPLEVMRGAATAGKDVGADGVTTLLDVATKLDPAHLRVHGDTIRLAPLIATAPTLADQSASLDRATESVDHLPKHTWFGPVNRARASLAIQLHSIVGYVDAAANATRVLPEMLGSTSPKRYFIGLQNEAEMRGTGGLPGAFAILRADKGKLTFEKFFSDNALLPKATNKLIDTGLNFGEGYQSAYGSSEATSFIVNSNLSPHFPYAARIWAKMWKIQSGETVDGAMAVDPTTLALFLNVTGPVRLKDGMIIDQNNVVSLTEKDEYTMFNDNNKRKDFLVSILEAASKKLTSGAGSAGALAKTITAASKDNRLLAWSASPSIERVIAKTTFGGAIPKNLKPFGGLVLNNIAAGKLDYYLTRQMDYHRSGCGKTRDVFVTIKLTNEAPPAGLPPYVVDRIDQRNYPIQPGDNRTLIDYYATTGAQLLSATLNGKPTTISVESDLGKRIFRYDMELPRGTTQTLTLHLQEPAGSGAPKIWRQPGVTPLALTFFDQKCD
jgi:hypothetical protein